MPWGPPKQPDIRQKDIKANNQIILYIISPMVIIIAYMLQCIALPVLPRGWPILPMACSAHEEGVSS